MKSSVNPIRVKSVLITLSVIFLKEFIILPQMAQCQEIRIEIQGQELENVQSIEYPTISIQNETTVGQDRRRPNPNRIFKTNIIIKQLITDDRFLYEWFKQIEEGREERKAIEVTYDYPERSGRGNARWRYERAYPVKYQTSFINGTMQEIVEFTFERWEMR